ncbi:PLAC8-domain-containing protein [Penicillium verhagenii]|uniref:PLAC8-domain-containing protein n=1 Tax=Penicillium verhagenii TaxID=1562060 RepID=UPI0025454A47|nr:PLAC8-domain-containing protein [Penicillium verhagenii]KAJ5928991.1 PLAC8-domain-containing protein [Penicillium verhagenii]
MLATFCPCALLGRTSSRLRDPELKESNYINGDCCIYLASNYCYLCWVPLMFKRRHTRQKFGISGSGCNDCMAACFCPCCLLVQQEKEVETQYTRLQSKYQAPEAMKYSQ